MNGGSGDLVGPEEVQGQLSQHDRPADRDHDDSQRVAVGDGPDREQLEQRADRGGAEHGEQHRNRQRKPEVREQDAPSIPPSMKNSPCAKLIAPVAAKTIVKPSATSE